MNLDPSGRIGDRVRRLLVSFLARPRLASVAGAVVIGTPAIIAVVRLTTRSWFPTGDFSHTELMLRSIPEHPPLVGVAARVGDSLLDQGSTPGPSMAYLLYPVYLLGGRNASSMAVSVLLLHLGALAGSLYVAWKLAGWRAVWSIGLLFVVMVRSLAPEFFLEPWNVWVPLFAFALFVLLVWGSVLGHRWMLVGAAAVGTHCLQTHISYVPLVIGLLTLACAALLWREGRERKKSPEPPDGGEFDDAKTPRTWWSPWTASALVLTLMWIPPMIEQLRPGPGNLGRLWGHFTSPTESTVGFGAALRAMAGEFNLAGPFVLGPGHLPVDSPNIFGFIAFAAVAASGVALALKNRNRRVLGLQAVLATATLIGIVATARIFGYFYDYVIRWMWVLAAMWMAASVWAMVAAIGNVRRRRGAMIGGCLVASALVVGASTVDASVPLARDSRVVEGLTAELERNLDPTTRYLLRWHDPAGLGGTGFGLVLAMEKRGIPLFVDAWAGAAAQKHRVRDVATTDAVLCLEIGPENIAEFSRRGDVALVASADPRSDAETAESNDLRRRIESGFREAGRSEQLDLLDSQYGHTQILMDPSTPSALVPLLQRYNELRLPAAVFTAPQGSLCIP